VNRFDRTASTIGRALAISCLVAAAALLTGCSAGQLSQTSAMEPAVNGVSAAIGNIALRDIRIVADQTSDALRPPKTADLRFVAINQSPDATDMLIGISSDVATVALTANAAIPPAGTLIVGSPEAEAKPLAAEGASTAKATVSLTKPISNGLTYDFTFRFAKAGQTTVAVPISAGINAPRMQQGTAPGGH
jgi:copper(I)-binding protein